MQAQPPSTTEVWAVVAGQLRDEMSAGSYASWVEPLRPVGLQDGVFRVEAANRYACDWVESRLNGRITRLLEVLYNQPVRLRLAVWKENQSAATVDTAVSAPPAGGRRKKPAADERGDEGGGGSPRKMQLQRAYGTERARVIKPEQGMFITKYFLFHWLPLLGQSAFTTVMAARALCYWNPMNGELRNTVETDMAELAKNASVSVRTVKDVLNNELIRKYFLRYKVRRVMTPNGVRTAGIILQVRMDDPLTPEDQEQHHLTEDERWFTADFDSEEEA
jgi:chromosomal replication initiation ATPase DnaA